LGIFIQDKEKKLFRHHEAIKAGDFSGVHSVQAGLWQIREEWVDKIEKFN